MLVQRHESRIILSFWLNTPQRLAFKNVYNSKIKNSVQLFKKYPTLTFMMHVLKHKLDPKRP